MKRNVFIQQLAAASLGAVLPGTAFPNDELIPQQIQPSFLVAGDTIAITSPAGYITFPEIMPAIRQMESWGLNIKIGSTIGKRDGTFGGTDEERKNDLQQLINDPSVKAVMCARGGYGLIRIIDSIDFRPLKKNPKWLIGFSDVTVLHCHLFRKTGIASIHSKMCNSFPSDWLKADEQQKATILSIRDLLFGVPMKFDLPASPYNQLGTAYGQLVGGNCKTIESLAGSGSDLHTRGKILYLEDTGEYLYSIDRMFWNIKRSGKLEHLAGLIIGGFKHKPSEDPFEEFGKQLPEIVLEKLKDCPFPVCFDFPVGHQKNNFAIKNGAFVQLEVTASGVRLFEKKHPS